MISYVGLGSFLISLCAFALYFYIAVWGNRIFWGVIVPGWISIILFLLLFGGIILLSLGIVAEYLWRIYDEVKDRPGYIIKNK